MITGNLFPDITAGEKLAEIQRELGMRRRVYPRRIGAGLMTREKADLQIRILVAIEDDYVLALAEEDSDNG